MLQADLVDGAWSLLRNRIAKEVLNTYELIPVPSLSAADHFGLFSVFVKSKSVICLMRKILLFRKINLLGRKILDKS